MALYKLEIVLELVFLRVVKETHTSVFLMLKGDYL